MKIDIIKKDEIYESLYQIEEERNSLMYGKPKEEQTKKVLEAFKRLKTLMKEALKNERIEI